MIYLNHETPPGIKMRAAPQDAAIGGLQSDRSIEDVAAYLAEHGIPEDRIHFLSGKEGISFLEDLGNWFSKVLGDGWSQSRNRLVDGTTLLGVFDVSGVDASRVRQVLRDAGVEGVHYFGKWTIS